MFSAPSPLLAQSPQGQFTQRDWIALSAICLVAVVVRLCVMALLPSILHPDEVMWLEQANRIVNHQGLVPWDFQVGERSWLWPGVIAAFMALGQLFGPPPSSGLGQGACRLLLGILSLAPVTCAFLWGRNVAGFAGAATAALLNAIWYELVYFYAHPISETFAGAALVIGLYLVYPDRLVPSERRLFTGAMMLGAFDGRPPATHPRNRRRHCGYRRNSGCGSVIPLCSADLRAPIVLKRPAGLGHLGLAIPCLCRLCL